jgi:hypothetical protein
MANDFPAEIEQFIGQHIESLAQLEMLLLLRKESDRSWSCFDLARQLYIGPDSGGAAVDQLIDQLSALYQQRRVAVITLIYSKPVKKVQTFADAFRLRREQ